MYQEAVRQHAGGHRSETEESKHQMPRGVSETTHLIAPESAMSIRTISGLEWLIDKILP